MNKIKIHKTVIEHPKNEHNKWHKDWFNLSLIGLAPIVIFFIIHQIASNNQEKFNPETDVCLKNHVYQTNRNTGEVIGCSKGDWRPKTQCERGNESWIEEFIGFSDKYHGSIDTLKEETICREKTQEELKQDYCNENPNSEKWYKVSYLLNEIPETIFMQPKNYFIEFSGYLNYDIEMELKGYKYPKCEYVTHIFPREERTLIYDPYQDKNIEIIRYYNYTRKDLATPTPCFSFWNNKTQDVTNNLKDTDAINLILNEYEDDTYEYKYLAWFKHNQCLKAIPKKD